LYHRFFFSSFVVLALVDCRGFGFEGLFACLGYIPLCVVHLIFAFLLSGGNLRGALRHLIFPVSDIFRFPIADGYCFLIFLYGFWLFDLGHRESGIIRRTSDAGSFLLSSTEYVSFFLVREVFLFVSYNPERKGAFKCLSFLFLSVFYHMQIMWNQLSSTNPSF
jgi:hypothetical protein